MTWKGGGDRRQAGTIAVPLTADVVGQATVAFDPPFSSPPVVTVSAVGTFYISHLVSNPTTDDVVVGVRRYNDTTATATITVHWRAEP